MFAFDVDGTLTESRQEITAGNALARGLGFANCRENGLVLRLCLLCGPFHGRDGSGSGSVEQIRVADCSVRPRLLTHVPNLLLAFNEPEARARLSVVNEQLREVAVPDGGPTIAVSVSMGFAAFDSAKSLDEVIRVADSAMYGTKRSVGNGQADAGDTRDNG